MSEEPLDTRIRHFIQKHSLLSGQPLLVGVSGGPDSVCLLHLLSKLRKELEIELHAAHLNHMLRGAESEADAIYVADLCHRLHVPITVEQRDVSKYRASQHRLSPEEAAREVRYNFLAEVARSIGTTRSAVGHTLDDHIETILMHLIRGTGTRGLCGLQSYSRWQSANNSLTIIRPLLHITRQETASYCRQHRLAPRLDTSNLSPEPLRNRIRHRLIPLLQGYNPRMAEALLRTARIAGEDIGYIDGEVSSLWNTIAQEKDNSVAIDKERFLGLPPALKRHLLLSAIEKLSGNIMDIEARHIEVILDALTKPSGKQLNLPHGLTFAIEYDRYLIGADPAALAPLPPLKGEFELNIPGETLLPGWRIEATVTPPKAVDDAGDYKAYFDFERTGGELAIRARRPGDKFQPLGMSGPKKVNTFMIDARIPRAWRQRVPLFYSHEQIIWIAGWRIDDRVKVTDKTRQILCLKLEQK